MNEQTMLVAAHAFGFQSTMLGCSAFSIHTECVSLSLLALSVVCGVASSAGGGDYQCCLASFGSLHTWNKRTETVSRVCGLSKKYKFSTIFFCSILNLLGR